MHVDDFKIEMTSSLTTHQEQSVVKMSVVAETRMPVTSLEKFYAFDYFKSSVADMSSKSFSGSKQNSSDE